MGGTRKKKTLAQVIAADIPGDTFQEKGVETVVAGGGFYHVYLRFTLDPQLPQRREPHKMNVDRKGLDDIRESAKNRLAGIKFRVSIDKFNYLEEFPESGFAQEYMRKTGKGDQRRTMDKALEEWIEAFRGKVKESTWVTYKRDALNVFAPALKGVPVVEFCDLFRVQEFITARCKIRLGNKGDGDLSAHRIANMFITVKHTLDREVGLKTIPMNPMRQLTIGEHLTQESRDFESEEPDPFSRAELKALIEKNPGWKCYILMCAGQGPRVSEAMGMQWGDVSFVEREAQLQRVLENTGKIRNSMKNKHRKRTIHLSDETLAALKEHRAVTFFGSDGDFIFVDPSTKKRWEYPHDILNGQWRAVCKRAGVRYRGPNQLAHTYACLRIETARGIQDYKKIAEEMGHRGIRMLEKHYAAQMRKRDAELANEQGIEIRMPNVVGLT